MAKAAQVLDTLTVTKVEEITYFRGTRAAMKLGDAIVHAMSEREGIPVCLIQFRVFGQLAKRITPGMSIALELTAPGTVKPRVEL